MDGRDPGSILDEIERIHVTPYLQADEHICPRGLKDTIDRLRDLVSTPAANAGET